jgi:hypothetical protein
MLGAANPALVAAQASHQVVVLARKGDCRWRFDLFDGEDDKTACGVAKRALVATGVDFRVRDGAAGAGAIIRVGTGTTVESFDGRRLSAAELAMREEGLREALAANLRRAGFPAQADPRTVNGPAIILSLLVLITAVSALSGPVGAALSELFPARIRYTALSLPYHVGLGWFGGFMPAIGFATVAATGNVYSGVWYPLAVTLGGFFISILFFPQTLPGTGTSAGARRG